MQKQLKTKINNKVWKYYILAFFLPLVVQVIAYAMGGYFPFGDKTILTWDMDWQYVSFFSWLMHVLKGKTADSLWYSFSISYGGATIGLLGYYLLSPYNFFLLLFSEEWLPVGIQLVTMLKIASCGVSMYYFVSKRFKRDGYVEVLFALMYAMMGYTVTQQSNIMWLDGVILLPVILLWIYECIANGSVRRSFPWVITLLVISDFYIAYMVVLFAICYFIGEWIAEYGITKWREWFKTACKLVLPGLIGVALSAVLLVPVVREISNVGRGGSGGLHETLSLIFDVNKEILLLPMKELLGAWDQAALVDGLPNIFVCLVGFVFFILYWIDNRHPINERLGYGIILGSLLLSFMSVGLNQVWHGFTYASGCNYRYSFCASFMMIYIGYQEYRTLNEKRSRFKVHLQGGVVIVISTMWLGYVMLQQFTGKCDVSFSSAKKWMATGVAFFIAVGFVALLGQMQLNMKHSKAILGSLTIFMVLELTINMCWSMKDFNYRGLTDYQQFYTSVSDKIEELQQNNEGKFYRVEHKLRDLLNDALLIGYSSITHYSSVLQNEVAQYAIDHNSLVDGIGRQATEYRADRVDAEQAGKWSIKYLLTYELPEDMAGWKIIENGSYYVLENTKYRELFYFDNADDGTAITNVKKSDDITIDAEAEIDCELISSIPYRDGWTITIDGKKIEPDTEDELLIKIPLEKGKHTIHLQYHQPSLLLGVTISSVALLGYLGWLWFESKCGQNGIMQRTKRLLFHMTTV